MKESRWSRTDLLWAGVLATAVVFLAPQPVQAEPAAPLPEKLSVTEALDRAYRKSPVLRIREAEVAEARGRLTGAEMLLPFNPELEVGVGRREGGGNTALDWEAGLSQEIEIFGQRSDRIDVAQSGLKAAQSRLLRARRLLTAQVQIAFAIAVRARELVQIEETNVKLATELLDVAEKRFQAGSTTRLDVNLANAELGHAQRGFYLAQAEYEVTRAILAETIGSHPSSRPEPQGQLRQPQEPVPSVSTLLKIAVHQRADLSAIHEAVQTAKARIALARSEAIPNVTLRAFFEREEETDTIMGGGLSLPIPLFNRNQGEIAEAAAARDRADAEAWAAQLQIEQEVISTHARFQASLSSAEALRQRVMGTLEENFDLLSKSFKSGKVGLTDVLIIRRSLLESRAEYIEALAAAQTAHIELLLAAGQTPTGKSNQSKESER